MDSSSLEAFATAAAAVISLGAVYVSLRLAHRTEVASRESHGLSSLGALQDWRRDIREWAWQTIDVVSELEYHLRDGGKPADEISRRCVHRLSAAVEKGRFFLPNQDRDKYELSKPLAYRGLRHAALDPLVAALRVGEGSGNGRFDTPAEAVCEMKRLYVSATQALINPDHQNSEIARVIVSSHAHRASDHSLNGLLPTDDLPKGAEALIESPVRPRLTSRPAV